VTIPKWLFHKTAGSFQRNLCPRLNTG
jgi:hypothetical protein